MKNLKNILFTLFLGIVFLTLGQDKSVGINTNTPNSNAVLELVSPENNQGFLVPRLSTIQRQALRSANDGGTLSNEENGLMVFDTGDGLFYYWNNGQWTRGLGVLSDATAQGDLTGTFPNLFLKGSVVDELALADLAVSEEKIQNEAVTLEKISANSISTEKVLDGAITGAKLEDLEAIEPGTYGNQFTVVRLSLDKKGRVVGFAETAILITSQNIQDLSLLNEDIADGTITISKIDPEENTDRVLGINPDGQVFWEDRQNFVSSTLNLNEIYIGNVQNIAEGLPGGGDNTATNSGVAADLQINDGAVTTNEILDETISAIDIGTDAVGSDEILESAVGTSEIENLSVQTIDIADDAVTKEKINEDVAGQGLSQNDSDGSLQVNLGNGIKFDGDTLVADLEGIAGDGLVENSGVLDVNVWICWEFPILAVFGHLASLMTTEHFTWCTQMLNPLMVFGRIRPTT